jgi:hypothetical protein
MFAVRLAAAGLAVLVIGALFGRPAAHAQPDRAPAAGPDGGTRSIEAVRADAAPRLDGRLDEPAWRRARAVSGFTQQEPVEGGEPTEKTALRVVYTDEALYIGVRLFYADSTAVIANTRQRDASLGADDRLMWTLDPYNSGRDAYFFETNPAGLRGDGLLTTGQGSSLNKSWDGIWSVEVSEHADGWTAEVRVPFRSLQFDPGRSTWGFNVQRTVRTRNEEVLWTGFRRDQGIFRPRFAGEIRGLTGLERSAGVEATPYVLGRTGRAWEGGAPSTDASGDVGGTLTYSLTPTLRGALTVNTDFAQVEVDQRRVNLTRFPLFFPERRDFFLDGSSIFEFAPSSAQYPYFSRRIGLVDGQQVPLLGGVRVNGRTQGYDVGFLQIRTREAPGVPTDTSTVPAEDFTVARVARNVGAESQVGVIYTRRASHADTGPFGRFQNRHTLGGDLELGTSRLFGNQNAQFQAFFVWHNAPLKADTSSWGHRTTRGVRLNYPNDPWSGHVSYREFGNAYDPAVGFVFRRGFRRLQPTVGYAPVFENHPWIRQVSVEADAEYLVGLDLEPQTVNAGVPVALRLNSGDEFSARLTREFERLQRPFDILGTGRIVVPAGTYRTWSGEVEVETASYRLVATEAEVERAGFWTGTRNGVSLEATVRPITGLRLSADWEYTDASLREGDFQTHVLRADGTWAPTPDLSVRSQLQYDNLSGRVGYFGRLRWIVQPGSDLFVVYQRNWTTLRDRFEPITSEAAVKLTYSIRF